MKSRATFESPKHIVPVAQAEFEFGVGTVDVSLHEKFSIFAILMFSLADESGTGTSTFGLGSSVLLKIGKLSMR